MKRFLRGFIFAFIAILSFTLISCGNEETTHEHTPSAVWSRDSASHWHACEVEGCDELLEFSLHTLSDWTKIDGECKEKRECTVCGFATTREIAHEFVDGLCVGCGLEEGNYEVEQFYVRGEHNGWGSPEEHALVYDPKTKTASIQITLEEGKKFKVADASWSEGRNFGAANCIYEAGLFEGTDDIVVLTTADYIITVSGYDTGEYSVEIKIACKHEFGTATPVEGKQCEFTEKCSLCGVVNQYTKHTFTDADIICDVCGHADLKVYYVKGSFNGFAVNEEFELEYDETTHTATVDLWLQVGHSFKIGTASGTDEEQWRFSYDTVTFGAKAKDAFIPDNDRNMYCVAKGADALGVKFTVTITGLNTINHTMTIDTEEEYSVESVNLPTSSSGLFVRGSMNGFEATDSYGLSSSNGVSKITLTLTAGDSFKVGKSDTWDGSLGWANLSDKTGFEETGTYGGDIKVLTSGTYTIIVSGTTLTIEKVDGSTGGNGGTDTPVDPDQGDTPSPNPVKSDLYLLGDFNGWVASDSAKLIIEGQNKVYTVKLYAGCEFKVRKGETWDEQYYYVSTLNSALVEPADGSDMPNIKVKAAGEYKITLSGTTLSIVKVGEYTCVSTSEHTLVDASCTSPKHCTVVGCGYQEGEALGHDWDNGVVSGEVKTYSCERTGCSETKEEAVAGFTIYLTPNENWKQANARFAVYLFQSGKPELWLDMKDSDGDGIYEVILSEAQLAYTNIIFCRMDPTKTANNWNNKWNQTDDLKVQSESGKMYTVPEDTWDKGTGSWS